MFHINLYKVFISLNFEPTKEIIRLRLRTIVPILLRVAFYTVAERKVIRRIQRRRGPSEVGIWGLLQAIADGIKLVFKEVLFPLKIKFILFLLAPIVVFSLSLMNWAFLPLQEDAILIDLKYSLLRIVILSSLGVYGIIFRGWSSNSRYPFLGRVRAATQIISYELSLTFIIILICSITISFNIVDIIYFQNGGLLVFPLFPLFSIIIIVRIAETNRTPFDLPEREAELVAGYNLEYSSIPFRLFFLGEYSNIILISSLVTILFFGTWTFFILKIIFFIIFFIVVRATLPRFRYDQLIILGWQNLLPILLGYSFIIYFLLI